MINISNKVKIRRILICVLLVATVCSMLIFAGCTPQEEKSFFEKFGGMKAYNKSKSGTTLGAPKLVEYYVDSSVTGAYKTAVTTGISLANALTKNVTFTTTTKSDSKFVIKVKNAGKTGWAALNEYGWDYVDRIVYSTITINTYYTAQYGANEIKRLVLHELGHTYGLADLDDSNVKPYTIMYYQMDSAYIFTSYQEFDKENINWRYN